MVAEGVSEASAEALHALRRLGLRADRPDELTLLERSWKSTVLRAAWAGARPWRVVLKRCESSTAETEAAVHADVLPRIQVRAPELFGVWREGEATWLAFEDMGDEPPDLEDDSRRELVSRWLGELHRGSRGLTDTPPLPERGAGHYAGLLGLTRKRLLERRAEAASGDEARRLARAIRVCDSLESRWDAVESEAARLPAVLVHADVAPENLRLVRSATGRLEVTAIDWEKAGIGTPFADLAFADPAAYAAAADSSPAVVSSSVWVGRLLAALSHNWAVKPLPEVERYRRRLERALAVIGAG